jgi:hypothetical protein
MKRFFYVYILVSAGNEERHYTGITQSLAGTVKRTQPWRMSAQFEIPAVASGNSDCLQFGNQGARI